MLAEIETEATLAERWLLRFEQALTRGDSGLLEPLFHRDSHWRDVVALSWDIKTLSGREHFIGPLGFDARQSRPHHFALSRERTPPRVATRSGIGAIEAIFRFETAFGRGSGVLRLTPADGSAEPKAWALLTALDELKGYEEQSGRARPSGKAHSRDFRGPNWLDLRRKAARYEDRDPAVIVVGGGQAGLSIAARLGQLGVDTLIVDREGRIGDNWRNRYHALTLHNQVQVNHLPYMPFPASWPTYIPKDKLAGWFETYVESLELNFWTETEFEGGGYDERHGRWTVSLRRADGTRRQMQPRHIVLATGVSGIPNLPDIPGLKDFAGKVVHSSRYEDGEAWAGKRALVIGTGNSGHDIAQDLYSGGAKVTLVQRSPTLVVNIEPSA